MQMVTYTKESGVMIKPMVMALLWIQTVQDMWATGLMTCNMVRGKNLGTMEKLYIQVPFSRAKNTAKEDSNGKMALFMMETSLMVSSKAMGNTSLLILTSGMKVNSDLLTWRAEESKLGTTAESMKVTLRMERKTERVLSCGPTAISTLAAGEEISNMVLASTTISKRAPNAKGNGSMVKGTTGLTDLF